MSNPANGVSAPIVVELFPSEAELNTLAENMSDKDMRALIIQMYRMQKKMYAFMSDLENMISAASQNPMFAAMLPKRR